MFNDILLCVCMDVQNINNIEIIVRFIHFSDVFLSVFLSLVVYCLGFKWIDALFAESLIVL